jgi:hypothetical protein
MNISRNKELHAMVAVDLSGRSIRCDGNFLCNLVSAETHVHRHVSENFQTKPINGFKFVTIVVMFH